MAFSSRSVIVSIVCTVSAIALLYTALFKAPEIYSTSPRPLPVSTAIQRLPEDAEMTTRATKFTPEVLLSAPRRSPAVPNADGTFALYTVSTYSFESHRKTREIRILDLKESAQSTLITNDEKASEPNWLENEILYLKDGDKGSTHVVVASLNDVSRTYTAGIVPGPISDVKLKVLEKGKVAIVFSAKAAPDGSLYNPENEPKKYSTGLVFDSLMVRHWDKYVTPNTNSIWYGLLELGGPHITETRGRYSLSSINNVLKDTDLESPIPPFGDSTHFDVSKYGIAFVAKDPALNPALNTKCDFYYLPISNFNSAPSKVQKASTKDLEGACSSPVFSPDGRGAAFLKMKTNGYESDKHRPIFIPDLKNLEAAIELFKSDDGKGSWDRSPSSLTFSNNGQHLYMVAEEEGKVLLWKLDTPATPLALTKLPEVVTTTGTVSSVFPLSATSTHLFLSSSNLVDNSIYSTIDPANPSDFQEISSNSRNGSSFNLSKNQVSDIWFTGDNNHKVHAWVIKPSTFSPSAKYPLAYLIHGGPQGAWDDGWSTRWNPAIFAEQGYVVVTPNPTGSTGYGQAFTDAIHNNWGGSPYEDLVAGFEHIERNLDYVDTSRAVALGASYGGYMMNWLQGHPLGRRFRALVCHDGVFSMHNQMSSDEQYFPNHDMGGPYYAAAANWDRWDPSRLVGNWSTPMLVVHNELDYRLPISEGLAAFNVLQERGVPSRFLAFPDENHWVLKEENSLVWHTVVLNWINRFAGLEPYKEEGKEGFVVQSPKRRGDGNGNEELKALPRR